VKEPQRGNSVQELTKPGTFFADIKSLLQNPRYVYSVLGYTAFTFTVGGFASWAPKYLVSVRGFPLSQADTLFGALTVITGFTGTLAGGWVATYFKKPNSWLVTMATLIGIPLTFAAFFIPNATGFFITIGLAEFFLFMSQAPINVLIVESVSPLLRGMASAVNIFVIHLFGDLISPPLVGYVSDRTSIQIGILILPLALILGLFFYWRLHVASSAFFKNV
jgi:sugar phosphate permease